VTLSRAVEGIAAAAGVTWFDHQLEAFTGWHDQQVKKACLYFKTGSGKSITSLAMMKLAGQYSVLVVAPPSTHPEWQAQAAKLGMDVDTISHAKFRQPDYKLSRHKAVVVDEFHMLGGNTGKGWMKMDRMARHLQVPLVICSATPNYNDAERVYCIKHVLDPHGTKGGFLEFLHQHCNTRMNPFGATPLVDEDKPFQRFDSAAEFLASLPGVYYLEDDLVYTIGDVEVDIPVPAELETYGYDRRGHRLMASQMEERHTTVNLRLVDDDGYIHSDVWAELITLVGQASTPTLVFSMHATVAHALAMMCDANNVRYGLVDGAVPTKQKALILREFKQGRMDLLIGTASLATGTDGLDKMCDNLIILDDTDDDALRRQLIGRIMPRGMDTDASKKVVTRITLPTG
jgi:superfamily II DNA or RNA helicase